MSYFIFLKDKDNIENTIYKIAENENDLTTLNIIQNTYKIIKDDSIDFNLIKCKQKIPLKYNNDIITFTDQPYVFEKKEDVQKYIDDLKIYIKNFTNNNINHPSVNKWENYYNQLSNLNLDNITYPLKKSLELYFYDLGQPSLNPLQLP
jgi:hypothetical protein